MSVLSPTLRPRPSDPRRSPMPSRPDAVLDRFDFDKSTLRPTHETLLRRLARHIVARASTARTAQVIHVVGHTDSRGSASYNAGLGRRRALAVHARLVALIDALRPGSTRRLRITVSTRAETEPVAPSITPEGRARNRRVEVFLVGAGSRPARADDAVLRNRHLSRALGWQAYRAAISRHLRFATGIPDELGFVNGVRRWQRGRHLPATGVLDANSLGVMRKELQSIVFFPGDQPAAAVTIRELAIEPDELRRVRRELPPELADEADRFVTEVIGPVPEGHQNLTRQAAMTAGGFTSREIAAMVAIHKSVDQPSKSLVPAEQKRHFLRRSVCQRVQDAHSEALNHLRSLHARALAEPDRLTKFDSIGEALHLIQDSFSNAHTERRWGGKGGRHRIVFIRFFGVAGHPFPIEHRVVPPPDPRDLVSVFGVLNPWSAESVAASVDFLNIIRGHIAAPPGPPSPAAIADLAAFIARHLALDPAFTPTTRFYPPPRCHP